MSDSAPSGGELVESNPQLVALVPTVIVAVQICFWPVRSGAVQVAAAVSSLVMVPFAVAAEITAFITFDSVTVKVSSGSTIESSTTTTVLVNRKVSRIEGQPQRANPVKSAGDSAVSPLSADAVKDTVTVLPLSADSVTTNDR